MLGAFVLNCFNPTDSAVCCVFIIFSVSRLPCVLPCPKKRKLAGDQRLPTEADVSEGEKEEGDESKQVLRQSL